jgi:hypothetical protein
LQAGPAEINRESRVGVKDWVHDPGGFPSPGRDNLPNSYRINSYRSIHSPPLPEGIVLSSGSKKTNEHQKRNPVTLRPFVNLPGNNRGMKRAGKN